MRKIIAALLLTCMLTFTAMAGDMQTPGSSATDGVIECPLTGEIQTPFADGQMEFPIVFLIISLL